MTHTTEMTAAERVRSATRPAARYALSKVPEATVLFWTIKILTTGMGEATSDALIDEHGDGIILFAVLGLIASMVWQFSTTRYRVVPYWINVAMVSIVGTMLADAPRQRLHLTFEQTTVAFALAVVACLGAWWLSERTLSIHSITSRRREAFYWATVMSTFALGTALGDLAANTWHLGFLKAGWYCIGLIVLPGLAYRFVGLNGVVAFWTSYVVTRPLGASFADWSWVPHPYGLGLGRGHTAIYALIAFAVLLAVAVVRKDGEPRQQLGSVRDR